MFGWKNMFGWNKAVLCNPNLSSDFEQKHKHTNKPKKDPVNSMKSGANTYLSVSISSSPPLHQEVAALGEAWGRHSRTASPPLWTTVDFFTGRGVKSGGEAEEQIRAESVCLRVRRSNSCASAENVKRISGYYRNCNSPLNGLIVWKKYGNEGQRHASVKSHFSHVLFIHGGSTFILLIAHHVYSMFQSLPPLAACDESKIICLPTTLSSALAKRDPCSLCATHWYIPESNRLILEMLSFPASM